MVVLRSAPRLLFLECRSPPVDLLLQFPLGRAQIGYGVTVTRDLEVIAVLLLPRRPPNWPDFLPEACPSFAVEEV